MKIELLDADPKGKNCWNCKYGKEEPWGKSYYTFCSESDGDGFGNLLCVTNYVKCDYHAKVPHPRKPRKIRKL